MDDPIIAPMRGSIKYVNRICVIRNGEETDLLSVKAKGTTEITLHAVPALIPKHYDAIPEDGLYELDFRLDESNDDITSVTMEVEVMVKLKDLPAWVKGIKVNAEDNSDVELL